MSSDRDVTRIVRSWMREDGHESADRVLDSVLDQLDTTPQRRANWPAWRTPTMSTIVTYSLGAAAVIVVLLVGANLLRFSGTPPGGVPSESVGPSEAEPSVVSSAAADLPVGSSFELMAPNVPVPNADLITVIVPAPGWYGEPGEGTLTKDLGADGRATVTVLAREWFHVPTDICRWQSTVPDTIPETADELVAALAAQTYETPEGSLTREPSTPVDITVDGDTGQSITFVVPTWQSTDPGACDGGRPSPSDGGVSSPRFCSLVDRDRYACWLSHLEPGYLDKLWVMGSGDSPPWVVDASYPPTATSELLAEIDAIVTSMTTD
jgi:hypothetical protein